jgi:hypothetical protein
MTKESPASRRFLRAELAGEPLCVKEWGLTHCRAPFPLGRRWGLTGCRKNAGTWSFRHGKSRKPIAIVVGVRPILIGPDDFLGRWIDLDHPRKQQRLVETMRLTTPPGNAGPPANAGLMSKGSSLPAGGGTERSDQRSPDTCHRLLCQWMRAWRHGSREAHNPVAMVLYKPSAAPRA